MRNCWRHTTSGPFDPYESIVLTVHDIGVFVFGEPVCVGCAAISAASSWVRNFTSASSAAMTGEVYAGVGICASAKRGIIEINENRAIARNAKRCFIKEL